MWLVKKAHRILYCFNRVGCVLQFPVSVITVGIAKLLNPTYRSILKFTLNSWKIWTLIKQNRKVKSNFLRLNECLFFISSFFFLPEIATPGMFIYSKVGMLWPLAPPNGITSSHQVYITLEKKNSSLSNPILIIF